MTRINVVPVKELCDQHLLAEWREMPRIVSALNKAKHPIDIPNEYVLGTGHMKFFYDKLEFLHIRHMQLTTELLVRGFNIQNLDSSIFTSTDPKWYNNYIPTEEALAINRERITERMPTKPRYTVL